MDRSFDGFLKERKEDSMTDIILYIGIIVVSGIIGSRIRGYRDRLGWTGKIQTLAIVLLVVLMGARMGSNEEIIDNLGTIGLAAFVMTAAMMIGSLICLFFARKALGFTRDAQIAVLHCEELEEEAMEEEAAAEKQGINKMTLIILCSVIVGMALGYLVARPVFGENIEVFDGAASLGIKIGLCILMVFVGLDLGLEGTVLSMMKEAGLRILVFPLACIVGTLLGAALCGLLFKLSLPESLAIGAGFGWYSLAPGIIMEAGYLTASAISFLHNVMREIFSILLLPLIAEKVGYIEAACIPGAPAMDVCLPIVNRATQGKAVTYGFVTGVTMSFLVPIMVPIMISL